MIKFESMLVVSYADLRKGKVDGKALILPGVVPGDTKWYPVIVEKNV